jgi:uncharacterized protein with NRDE domain
VCLLIVLSRTDPDHPLVVAANRDERLDRPAVAATVLAERSPRVIGGRDLMAGGTWLAVNEHGVVAGLTNRPSPNGRDPSKRSRGELPLALAAHRDATSAVEDFVTRFQPADYNSAWLLVGDRESLWYLELGEEAAPAAEPLSPGLHIMGNGPLHRASPKVDHVQGRIAGITGAGGQGALDQLTAALADHSIPEAVGSAPDGAERPKQLGCACVHTESFGTRSAALVQVPAEGRPRMWVADGPPCSASFASVEDLWTSPAAAETAARTTP